MTHDTELQGCPMKEGDRVLLAWSSANRDPAVFEHPDEYDLDRELQQSLAFGFGPHFCLGAHLARAEMETALDVVLERLPNLSLAGEVRYIGTVLRGPERLPVRF